MKPCPVPVLLLGLLALLTNGCAHKPTHRLPETGTPTQGQPAQFLELPRQTLTFQPTRNDLTVGKVVFSLYCSRPQEVRLNGVRPDPHWVEAHFAGTNLVVDTRTSVVRSNAWMIICLRRIATNRFELPPLRIDVTSNEVHGFICLSVKAWFNEIPNEYDAMFYHNLDDRYALVSCCTGRGNYPSEVKARFGMNRVATAQEFKERLARPFVIELNEQPIRQEWRSR